MAMVVENEAPYRVSVSVPPSWSKGSNQPSSVVQSLILSQIDSGASKHRYDLEALIVRQVEKSRVAPVPQNNLKTDELKIDANGNVPHLRHGRGKGKKENKLPAVTAVTSHDHGLTLLTQRNQSRTSPHLLLTTSTTGGGFLNVVDEKIYWRLSKHGSTHTEGRQGESPQGQQPHSGGRLPSQPRRGSEDQLDVFCSVAFAQIQPALDKCLRRSFRIDTQRKGKFGHDRDMFYPSICPPLPPEDQLHSSVLKKWRPTLFVLPKGENTLQLYDMENGQLHQDDYVTFDELTQFNKIYCHNNGNIVVQCMPSTLPPHILTEFLIFKYPHLRLETRVRIAKPAENKSGKITASFEFSDDFILVSWPSGRVEFFDLQVLLRAAQVVQVDADRDRNGYSTTTYLIEKLPEPLFSLKAVDQYLTLNPGLMPPYFVARTKKGYEIRELIRMDDPTDPQSTLIEGPLNYFDGSMDDLQVVFSQFQSGPPRIIVKERTRMRIYEIVRRDEDTMKQDESAAFENENNGHHQQSWTVRKSSSLRLLFDKEFLNEVKNNYEESDCLVTKRAGLRKIARKSYSCDESMTLCYDENIFLDQMAIVRFAEGWVRCYVYNMCHSYQLQYTIEPSFFQPKSSEIYDDLRLEFATQFIALVRKGTKDTSAYIFNLMKGLE